MAKIALRADTVAQAWTQDKAGCREGDKGDILLGKDRACSVVVIALRFGTQGPGFEPGLFHKACYMPLHGC